MTRLTLKLALLCLLVTPGFTKDKDKDKEDPPPQYTDAQKAVAVFLIPARTRYTMVP